MLQGPKIEILQQALNAFNRRDKAAWLAAFDPGCENIPPQEWPENEPIRGAEAVYEFFVESVSAWDEGAFEWAEVIDAGPNTVVANQRREMRGKASGASVAWNYWVVFTFRGEKVVSLEWFASRTAALEAARRRA
jgi:ketosteroid isomerase-like protein